MMWMGIDGGGSHVRVVIVDDDMREMVMVQGGAVNPSSIGRDEAVTRIREIVTRALQQANVMTVTGVGMGIAGATAEHSAAWLHDVMTPVLPDAVIHPSSDVEIALVGGRGCLHGAVLLVGTGSVAYGINREGRRHRVGGWGYLLGDEGSGYWMGTQALRTITQVGDGYLDMQSALPQRVMQTIGIQKPIDLIPWRYHNTTQTAVAQLAELVLSAADDGDMLAQSIVEQAANHLVKMATQIQTTLNIDAAELTYAGGLLTSDNALSRAVTQKLGLSAPPSIQYPPVIGAALLAKLKESRNAH